MSRRSITTTLLSFAMALAQSALPAAAADYRGMTAGWPAYANGSYAAYYPQASGGGPAYYVARPAMPGYAAPGYIAARPAAGTMYMPVRAAYANPTYYGAYNAAPDGYRAAPAAYAAPTAAYYAPPNGAAQYAPVQANYAPANSYAVTPAGIAAAGSEAQAYYGQPAAVNYVPPRFNYRTTYAPVPVYMYRPVTAYNAAAAQYSTCQQPIATTTCQTQRTRCFSWLNPFTWFHRGSCGAGGCAPAAVPTTAYCGTGGCAQPYYPTAPLVIPSTPAPVNVLPPTTFPTYPGMVAPPAGPVIPSPPTRFQNVPGFVPQGTVPQGAVQPGFIPRGAVPADTRPNLGPLPGGSFGAPPAGSTIITPGTTVSPGGSFQTAPATPPPGFTPVPGGFGTGTNYPPTTDPYRSELTPALMPPAPTGPSLNGNALTGPSHSVFGSGYQNNVIRAPELGPALPPNVQTVPDLEAQQRPQPVNRAPQLLGPRDKTAARVDSRWAVVKAKWPSQTTKLSVSQPPPTVMQTTAHLTKTGASAPVYDDGGWKSAR
jgi:hypothetical protein